MRESTDEGALAGAAEHAPLRQRLLREAADILVGSGMPGLTVRRIAEAAGCSTIGVYTHFGGKPGLVEAVLLDAYLEFEAAVAVVDVLPPGRGQLAAGAHAYRDWALGNRNRYQIMFTAYGPAFTPGAQTVERMTRSFVEHSRRVAAAVDVGDLAGDPAALAHQIWACVHGYVMLDIYFGRDRDEAPARQEFEAAFERILDGMAPRWE